MEKGRIVQLSLVILFSGLLLTFLKAGGQTRVEKIRDVLILGNSITKHEPSPELGWYGDWGMAASAKEKDYVHNLLSKFKKINPSVKFHIKSIVDFEQSYWNYNFSSLDSFKNLRPDLIILHIGENVNSDLIEQKQFGNHYKNLLNYLKLKNKNVKIICTSTFWNQGQINKLMEKAAQLDNCFFTKIDQLSSDSSHMALGKFKNKEVAMHPSDAGMGAIADLIWDKIKFVYKIKDRGAK